MEVVTLKKWIELVENVDSVTTLTFYEGKLNGYVDTTININECLQNILQSLGVEKRINLEFNYEHVMNMHWVLYEKYERCFKIKE